MNRQALTLVELMVVIVIISILSVFAYPAYTEYMNEARRSDAYHSLLLAQFKLEDYRNVHKVYTTDLAKAGIPTTSKEGHYDITVTTSNGNLSYVVKATAAKAPQTGDTGCTEITISDIGIKAPAACW